MNMTHYMELLATNQPWNLLRFMVVPVVIAEALVAIDFSSFITGKHQAP